MKLSSSSCRGIPHRALAILVCGWLVSISTLACGGTVVLFDTVVGSFYVELYDNDMPLTVANFLNYVTSNRYDGTAVHRNSDLGDGTDFVIQGGGYSFVDGDPTIRFNNVMTDPPIADEPGGGVAGPSNQRGTIAMAKTGPNTVTSQWFINQGDNSFLDDPNRADGGFSAFGEVVGNGMEVVDAIGDLPLPPDFGFSIGAPFNDLPLFDFSGDSIGDVKVTNTVSVTSISVRSVGDLDCDGDVDFDDIDDFVLGIQDPQAYEDLFGVPSTLLGDTDGDDDIDFDDIPGFVTAISEATVRAVPEPSFLALLGLGLATLFTQRRFKTGCSRSEHTSP